MPPTEERRLLRHCRYVLHVSGLFLEVEFSTVQMKYGINRNCQQNYKDYTMSGTPMQILIQKNIIVQVASITTARKFKTRTNSKCIRIFSKINTHQETLNITLSGKVLICP